MVSPLRSVKTFDIHQQNGIWFVADDRAGCGGVFITLDAALTFVRREAQTHGGSTRLVVR